MDIITISEQLKIPPSTTLSLCRQLSIPIFCQTTIECPTFGLDDHIGKDEEFPSEFLNTVEKLGKYSSDYSNQPRYFDGKYFIGSIYLNTTIEGFTRKFFTFKLDKIPQKTLRKIFTADACIDLFVNNSKTFLDTTNDYRNLYIKIEDINIPCRTENCITIEHFYVEEEVISKIRNRLQINSGFKSLQKNKVHVQLNQMTCLISERENSSFSASNPHTQNFLKALIEGLAHDSELEGVRLCELNTILDSMNCSAKSYEMLRSKNAAMELRHIIFQIERNGKKYISFRGKDDPENYPWVIS